MFKKLFTVAAAALVAAQPLPTAALSMFWLIGTHTDEYGRDIKGDKFIYYNGHVDSINTNRKGASIKVQCDDNLVTMFFYPVNFDYSGITDDGKKYGFILM